MNTVVEAVDEKCVDHVSLKAAPIYQSDNVKDEDATRNEYVEAAVRETDAEEPANTFRMWVLGFFFVTVSAGVNMFLSMRSPMISIPVVAILLLVYPLGCLWAQVVPSWTFNSFGLKWSLNPGPFNIKVRTPAYGTKGYSD